MRTGNALRLAQVDSHARKAGLSAGMTLADARARCPALATLPCDPAAERQALDHLARAMLRFTPVVTPDPPDGLILDVTGCAHLFGGEEALARRVLAATRATTRHAFAGNAMAARALARHGADGNRGDIHALPVSALDLPDDALTALRRAGLRTIGDLARRPQAGLAARFGESAVMRLRQLLGETASPVAPRLPPVPVRAEARFAEPLIRTDDALEVIEDLLRQAAQQMEQRHAGGRRFAVTLERSDGARRQLAIDTGNPVRDPATVLRLMRERIDTLADPLDPGFGFDAILLDVPRVEPLAPRQDALEGGRAAADDTLDALIDRLSVRLGADRVTRLHPADTHIPEAAQRLRPAIENTVSAPVSTWPLASGKEVALRPLTLFDPPQPVAVIAGVPDGPPQRFRWRRKVHEVRLAEGPERIAPEWWRRQDGHLGKLGGLTRDYYRIEDSEGRRYWMFRHGLFDEKSDPRWFLHGLFA
nr:DNA polymerase Y family protein [Novosphingobium sp. NBM11]